jgi:hypothetical protein
MERRISQSLTRFAITLTLAGYLSAQPTVQTLPVIDMHVHSTNTTPEQEVERMKQLNIRYIVLSALTADLGPWASALRRDQFAPGLVFPCDQGHAPYTGRPCFNSNTEFPDVAWLRAELQAGRIRALAELEPQYLGLSPADPRMEPYWQLAEEFDVPVGIHMGPAPAGIAYQSSKAWPPVKSPRYRMGLGDPLLLEEVLVKHQHLRLYVMHAGWPRLESMIALLSIHPAIYVDLAALQSEAAMPRAAYYRYLRGLVDAGFSKRIMFGSDFPDQVSEGISAIVAADFLSPEQKANILCNNAERFLRLDATTCSAVQETPPRRP